MSLAPNSTGTNVLLSAVGDTPRRAPSTRGPLKRAYMRSRRTLRGAAGIVVALGIWELISGAGIVSSFFISSPYDVARSLGTYITGPTAWLDVRTSGEEFLIGFALAVVIGVPIGLVLGWSNVVREICDPLLNFFYATPLIAIAPLFVVWFGIGLLSKVAIVLLLAIFPVIINTSNGVRTVDSNLINVARSFDGGRLKIFAWIILPGCVPSILAGLRLAAGVGLVGMVVAEFVAASAGVGFMINTASQNLDASNVFAGVVIIAGFGVILMALLKRVEGHFDKWRPER
jgi:ABC-type nitrate/sulfonate/bicarbonate transport system permease component